MLGIDTARRLIVVRGFERASRRLQWSGVDINYPPATLASSVSVYPSVRPPIVIGPGRRAADVDHCMVTTRSRDVRPPIACSCALTSSGGSKMYRAFWTQHGSCGGGSTHYSSEFSERICGNRTGQSGRG